MTCFTYCPQLIMFVCIDDIIESILKYFSEDFARRVYRASRVHVSSFPWLISLECAASSAGNNAYNSFFIAQVMEISS